MKNQQFFLDLLENWGHKSNYYPKYWGDRQAGSETRNLPEQKSMSKHIHRNQCQGREIWAVIAKLLEAQYRWLHEFKTPWGPSHRRAPTLLWVLLLGALPTPHSEYWGKKISSFYCREKEKKESFWNMPEHSVLNEISQKTKLLLPEPDLLSFVRT